MKFSRQGIIHTQPWQRIFFLKILHHYFFHLRNHCNGFKALYANNIFSHTLNPLGMLKLLWTKAGVSFPFPQHFYVVEGCHKVAPWSFPVITTSPVFFRRVYQGKEREKIMTKTFLTVLWLISKKKIKQALISDRHHCLVD